MRSSGQQGENSRYPNREKGPLETAKRARRVRLCTLRTHFAGSFFSIARFVSVSMGDCIKSRLCITSSRTDLFALILCISFCNGLVLQRPFSHLLHCKVRESLLPSCECFSYTNSHFFLILKLMLDFEIDFDFLRLGNQIKMT